MSNSRENYESPAFVQTYAKNLETNVYNASLDRPATLGLLETELWQKKVLDIGCGPGLYLDTLISRGAICTAFDQSAEMVKSAKARHPDAEIFRYELSADMPVFETESFDYLLAPLVFDYVKEWAPMFRELSRILKPEGVCIFSVNHPATNYANHVFGKDSDYFETTLKKDVWPSYGLTMDSYRRPLSEIFSAFLQNGFLLDALVEPRPLPECQAKFAEDYRFLSKNPSFLTIRIHKPRKQGS